MEAFRLMVMIQNSLLIGFRFFLKGLQLVFSPSLRRFIIIPILVNASVLIGLVVLTGSYLSQHFNAFLASYPSWLTTALGGLLWIIFSLSSLLLGTFLLTILTNLIASPFYGLLAEKTEKNLSVSITALTPSIWKALPHTIARELLKLLYFMPWFLLSFILFIIPPTLPLALLVWWVTLSCFLTVQYSDYTADHAQIPLKQMIKQLKRVPLSVLGFGGSVSFCMNIPGANLIIPPAAVAGGTAFWLALNSNDKMIK